MVSESPSPTQTSWGPQSPRGFSPAATRSFLTRKSLNLGERVIEKVLLLAGLSSMVVIALIFLFLFKESVFFFQTASPVQLVGKWVHDEWLEKDIFNMLWQPVGDVPKYS